MSGTIKVDGDTWRVSLGGRPGDRAVVFFCETTNQRPYRVVPVGDRFSSDEEVSSLAEEELRELYRCSRSMGAPTGYPTYGS